MRVTNLCIPNDGGHLETESHLLSARLHGVAQRPAPSAAVHTVLTGGTMMSLKLRKWMALNKYSQSEQDKEEGRERFAEREDESISTVYSALGCVVTGPDQKKVPVGSSVRLSCDLTQCLKSLGHHQISAEWEFIDKGSTDKARHHLIYHYHNRTVTVEPRVSLVGNISEGDFSLLLLSVTVQRSGTYLCRLRSPHGYSDIHESHTQVTVVERSGQHRGFPGDLHKPGVNHPDWLLPLCCVLFSLFLVGGVTVGTCVCRRRSPRQQNDKCHIQVNVTRGEDTQEANGNKDTNCYVTLQRLRAPPPSHTL
uniref:uncharacterized protein LOC124004882 n=1 Tax=Oncorhynchus gorbuscha TaxID=8017 RepID=UPI001EAF507A|nr:uncharacterized protein LOC124004882 [Oncorhynchus gorbuscha]